MIDADGLALAPGFLDPHTHYHAQLAWEPLVTCSRGTARPPSSWQLRRGRGSVKPETREILMQDLVTSRRSPTT